MEGMTEAQHSGRDAVLLQATVAGVPLVVSGSWIPTFVVAAAGCAVAARALAPGAEAVHAVSAGVAVSLALSLSLLIHELAHALVARRCGIEIEHVRLFGGGALCRRREALDHPKDQFIVAAAGPLASTALGVLALAGALAVGVAGGPHVLYGALWFVAFANVLVALSNLLPVFPFDGGKLVHALFWRSSSDRHMATRRLDRSGREFARVISALGFLLMAASGEILIGAVVALFGLYLLRLPSPP